MLPGDNTTKGLRVQNTGDVREKGYIYTGSVLFGFDTLQVKFLAISTFSPSAWQSYWTNVTGIL